MPWAPKPPGLLFDPMIPAPVVPVPKPDTPTDYLLHVVLYGPDGSYLASSDSPVFTVQ